MGERKKEQWRGRKETRRRNGRREEEVRKNGREEDKCKEEDDRKREEGRQGWQEGREEGGRRKNRDRKVLEILTGANSAETSVSHCPVTPLQLNDFLHPLGITTP